MKSSSGYEIYHNTLSACLDEIENYVTSKGYALGDYFPLINHISYGSTERTQLEMLKDGRIANTLAIQIYRLDSGKYELNCYPVRKFALGGGIESESIYKEVFDYLIGGDRPSSLITLKKQVDAKAKNLNLSVRQIYQGMEEDRSSSNDYHYFSLGGGVGSLVEWIDFSEPDETDTHQRYSSTTEFALKLRGDNTIYEGKFNSGSLSDSIDWEISPDYSKVNTNDLEEYVTSSYFKSSWGEKFSGGGGVNKSNFKGVANAKYENNYELHTSKKTFLIDPETNKIISTHSSPYEAMQERDRQNNPNLLIHFEKFAGGGYTRPSYKIITTGFFSFKTKDKEYYVRSGLFERQNDTEDSLQIQDELRGELGSIIIQNSAWKRLSDGKTIKARSSKGNLMGTLTRVAMINDSFQPNKPKEIVPYSVGDRFKYNFDNKTYEVIGIGYNNVRLQNVNGKWSDNREVTLSLMNKWILQKMMVKL